MSDKISMAHNAFPGKTSGVPSITRGSSGKLGWLNKTSTSRRC